MRSLTAALLLSSALVAVSDIHQAAAQAVFLGNSANGGNWFSAESWSTGAPPSASQQANITTQGLALTTATVSGPGAVASAVAVGGGNTLLVNSGGTLTTTPGGAGLILGTEGGTAASLFVVSGGRLITTDVTAGQTGSGTVSILVDGGGSSISASSINLGAPAPATMTVREGGSVASAGDLTIGAGSALVIGGAATAAPGTVAAGRLTGAGQINVFTNGAASIASPIEGGLFVTVRGGGLTLTGANTYAATTTVETGGTIIAGSNTAFGTSNVVLKGDVPPNLGAELQTVGGARTLGNEIEIHGGAGARAGISTSGGDLTLTGPVGLNGILVKQGNGTLTLTNNANVAVAGIGGIELVQGRLRLGANNAAGGADSRITTLGSVISYANGVNSPTPITINSSTTQLEVLTGEAATQSGVVGEAGGSRPLEKIGAGTLTLTKTNSYTGGTTVTQGGLIGTANNAFGTGALRVAGGFATIAAGTQQVASIALTGPGDATNPNLRVGGTLVSAGAMTMANAGAQVNAGGVLTAPTISLDQLSVLSNSGTINGALTNAGTISVSAGAVLNGPLTNTGGIATNNGLITGPVTVAGGTYQGTGTSGSVTLQPGARIAPGNSVGTLTVSGNLTFGRNSMYVAEVGQATADRINVTGTASLDGTLRLVTTASSYAFGSRYTLLSAAGGRTGTFAAAETLGGTFGPGIRWSITYSATDVSLTLGPNALSPLLAGVATTRNQRAVAAGLDAAVLPSTGNISAFFPLFNLQPAAMGGALDQLSGQVGTTATTLSVLAGDQFLRAMLDPWSRTFGQFGGPQGREMADIPSAPARPGLREPRVTTWATVFGAFGGFRADNAMGSASQSTSTFGIAVGADYRITSDIIAGIAMSGSQGNAANAGGLGRGSADTLQIGGYAMGRSGPLRLSSAVAYGSSDMTTTRQMPFFAPGDLSGRFMAKSVSARMEAGWRFDQVLPGFALTPFIAAQAHWTFLPRYTETTTSAALTPFALANQARTNTTIRAEIGAMVETRVADRLNVFARAAWANYFARDASVTATFAAFPGDPVTLTGARVGAQAARLSGGFDWLINETTTLTTRVDGEISGSHQMVNGSARLQVRF
jgi:autotransporter-associated beta strand protein